MCQNPNRLCNYALFALQMMYGSCSGGSPLQPLVTAHPPSRHIKWVSGYFQESFCKQFDPDTVAAKTHARTFVHV